MSTYKVIKLTQKFSDQYQLSPAEYKMLNHIDNSKYHMLSIDAVNANNTEIINGLLDKEMLRYVREHGTFPSGFAVTVKGSYALGTFDHDTL
jgi:hypothetical protein